MALNADSQRFAARSDSRDAPNGVSVAVSSRAPGLGVGVSSTGEHVMSPLHRAAERLSAAISISASSDWPSCGRNARPALIVSLPRGCFAAFRAVYECAVPVIAAVNGFCVGGGIGLVGNADVIVASDDATFGLPEVERGALGAATHLSRLVPQHMMRRLFFTAATVDAATLHHFGSVHEVVPRDELDEAALRVARDIAAKDTRVIRAAKEALNLIDVQRVNSSYRMEQGFTFELNLAGVSDEHRDAFTGTAKGEKK